MTDSANDAAFTAMLHDANEDYADNTIDFKTFRSTINKAVEAAYGDDFPAYQPHFVTTEIFITETRELGVKFTQNLIPDEVFTLYMNAYNSQWRVWLAETNSISHLSRDDKDALYVRAVNASSGGSFGDICRSVEANYKKFAADTLSA